MRPISGSFRLLSLLSVPVAALSVGCSNPGEDVRLTLCRDMVRVTLGSEPNWRDQSIEPRRQSEAEARLSWTGTDGKTGQASCYYPYNAVENDMFTAADPLAAYSTSPTRFVLDGRSISNPELARVIGQAMRQQGREFLDRARATLEGR
ncbi:hypothetical protein [Allochromatium palmeri]|uniref:Uncharacterized protein n=1 Tax=Allochromatium palmeri TaxID=231048 RepID=A0A6N8EAW8_9GAMM|nr:hypothetical protein [Allochromatium palmeri]MTW21305.1 hypothetical protein [Allochromatium palmeri]